MTKPILGKSYKNPEIEDCHQLLSPNFESQVPKYNYPVGIYFFNLEEIDKERILIDMFPKLESRSSDRMKLALAVLRENDEMAKAIFNAKYGTLVKKRYDFLVILLMIFVSAFVDLITKNTSASGESEMVYTGIASSLIILVSQVDHWRKKQRFGGADTFVGVLFATERLFKVSAAAWRQSSNISLPDSIVPLFSMLMMLMSKQYVSELTVLTLVVNCAFTCVLINKNYGILFIVGAWAFKRFDKKDFDKIFVKLSQKLKFLLFILISIIFVSSYIKSNVELA